MKILAVFQQKNLVLKTGIAEMEKCLTVNIGIQKS